MENHYFDHAGNYVGSAPANPDSLAPRNALRVPPPFRPGFRAVVLPGGGGWELKAAPELATPHKAGPEKDRPANQWGSASRREAYRRRADSLRDEALSYRLEAEGWVLAGETAEAEAAQAKSLRAVVRYLEEKRAIRREFSGTAREAAMDFEPDAEPGGRRASQRKSYFLADTGVYHGPHCRRVGSRGKWLREDDARLLESRARPCRVCRPPVPEACRE